MGKRIIFVVCTILLLYMAIIYNSKGLLLLGGMCLVLPPFFLCMLQIGIHRTKVSLVLPQSVEDKPEGVPLSVKISLAPSLADTKVKLTLLIENTASGEKKKISCSGRIYGTTILTQSISGLVFGLWQVSVKRLIVYDASGWFPAKRRLKEKKSIMVLPRCYDTNIRIGIRTRLAFADADQYHPELKGEDAAEIFKLREYQKGDRLNRVHWKLSAKNDTLIVKEMSLPLGCNVVVFLNSSVAGLTIQEQKSYWEIIYTISAGLLQEKCCHYLSWYEKEHMEMKRFAVRSEENLYEFWGSIMPKAMGSCDCQREYAGSFKGDLYTSWVELNHHLELFCNGKLLMNFRKEDIKRKLMEMELVL